MKFIDVPPLWLVLFLLATWFTSTIYTVAMPSWVGSVLICLGLVLMVLAFLEMRKMKTTVIPHQKPSALVQTGIFGISRNPIYLGDAIVLAGFSIWWDAPLGLAGVPIFMWVIQKRFIAAEENRLMSAFPESFSHYAKNTRRWL